MQTLLVGILDGAFWAVSGTFVLFFLLALWYIAVKLAAFAWNRGRKEAQNTQNRSNDGW